MYEGIEEKKVTCNSTWLVRSALRNFDSQDDSNDDNDDDEKMKDNKIDKKNKENIPDSEPPRALASNKDV